MHGFLFNHTCKYVLAAVTVELHHLISRQSSILQMTEILFKCRVLVRVRMFVLL